MSLARVLPPGDSGIAPGATELLELVDRWGDKPGDPRELALDALLRILPIARATVAFS
jgi:hypothetical protein